MTVLSYRSVWLSCSVSQLWLSFADETYILKMGISSGQNVGEDKEALA
jgi:hypothetical protein